MNNKQEFYIYSEDIKSEWGEGRWQTEPDMVTWDADNGMPCMIFRNPMGNFCGYVGVTRGISGPIFGIDYEDELVTDIAVHGGLTFAGQFEDKDKQQNEYIWWFGFDCAHAYDFVPAIYATPTNTPEIKALLARDATYCDIEYVASEVNSLAFQLGIVIGNSKKLLN